MALLENKNVILGSSSPRRKELLSMIIDEFEIISPDCDENINNDLDIKKAIEEIAQKKAEAIKTDKKDAIIITADTVVVLNEKILGKPLNRDDAFNMLKMLSGNIHKVITGVCIKAEQLINFSVVTEVEFSKLSDFEISEYLDTDEPYDKAGSYAVQGLGGVFVSKISGDYFNIVGLPINKLKYYLNKL